MELNYIPLFVFLFYLSMGIFLIVKNNNISASSRYLGLFFIAIGSAPLSFFLFKMNFYNAFILPFLIFQTHIFWFYYYINAVIGNKISKFNFYFSVSFFSVTFILNIYYVLEISQSGLFSSQTKIFPFQIMDNVQFSSTAKFFYLYRVLISFLITLYGLIILKKFKENGIHTNIKKDLYRWLLNMVIFLLIFSALKMVLFIRSIYLNIDYSFINSFYIIFTQLLLPLFGYQIFKFPLISLGIPINKRFYKPSANAIDQTSRSYLFDSDLINQKIIDWENASISYLNKDFNLSLFSKELEIDELEIIYYLNEYKEISFQEYLNFLRISFVIMKIEQNYLKDHSIKELAEVAGFSDRTRLEKTFKKIINCNLQEFISHE
jgi:AraC-like DNA-binding protein